jgi:hypothetical protein
MKIYDEYGIERNWAWLEREFGPLVIHPAMPGPGWRLVEVHADRNIKPDRVQAAPLAAPTVMVKARSADGRPAVDLWIAWYWPDAPENPQAMPVNGLPAGMRPNRADQPGITNLNGDVGLAMGPGAYYAPPAIGPHAVWVWGQNSDVILGLGMKGGTDHDHINLVFEQSVVDEPAPQPIPTAEVLARVERIAALCAEIRSLLSPAPHVVID